MSSKTKVLKPFFVASAHCIVSLEMMETQNLLPNLIFLTRCVHCKDHDFECNVVDRFAQLPDINVGHPLYLNVLYSSKIMCSFGFISTGL